MAMAFIAWCERRGSPRPADHHNCRGVPLVDSRRAPWGRGACDYL